MTAPVKVRTPAVTNVSIRTVAGVRKPPRDETAGSAGATGTRPHKSIWPPCGDDLRHLAAHRMADEHVATEPGCACNEFGGVGHRAEIVSPICCNGAAPTTLIESDRMWPAAEPINHLSPGA